MKRIYLLLLFLLSLCYPAAGQKLMQVQDKAFNFGAKVGFNSSFPIINSLTIEGVEAEDIRLQYRVGYLASIFCRVNIDRYFIQPSFSWQCLRGDLSFRMPMEREPGIVVGKSPYAEMRLKTESLEMPVLIGYSLVKEKPYGLNLMVGPVFKYNYNVHYTSVYEDQSREFVNDNTPFGINIAAGIGVSIGRLLLDFTYEFGLNEVQSDFVEKDSSTPEEGNMSIDKRTNVMSFSLGFLF